VSVVAGEQPSPIHRVGVRSVQQQVITDLAVYRYGGPVAADIAERERVGIERYGTPLQPHNGRCMIRDAYDENLDLVTYLRGAIAEQGETDELVLVYDRAINLAIQLRGML
jgi:hypothetical protein